MAVRLGGCNDALTVLHVAFHSGSHLSHSNYLGFSLFQAINKSRRNALFYFGVQIGRETALLFYGSNLLSGIMGYPEREAERHTDWQKYERRSAQSAYFVLPIDSVRYIRVNAGCTPRYLGEAQSSPVSCMV